MKKEGASLKGTADQFIDKSDPHFNRYKSHNQEYLHDYIVIIDAGSKGSRAHLYRTKSPYQLLNSPNTKSEKRDHDEASVNNYIEIELMKRTKIKPGIAEYYDSPTELNDKYLGKLLKKIESHIPKSQISRTPIFLHATGGMRLLPSEKQDKVMTSICEYLQTKHNFYLPDCATHVNVIDGELEGLYSWIGINYKEGVFNYDYNTEAGGNYGVFDLGGASTQLAFAPDSSDESGLLNESEKENLYHLELHYNPNMDRDALSYDVFSQSYLGGIDQIKIKYENKIKESEEKIDPCLSKDILRTDGHIKGSSDFNGCFKNLNDLLKEVSKERYCEQEDKSKCSLETYLPSKDYKFSNVKNFIGVNEFHDSLDEFDGYKEFYQKTVELCNSDKPVNDQNKDKYSTDECFKSTWIINILHESLGFPLYDDNTVVSEESISALDNQLQVLKKTSWTLGHAVLYQYDSIAQKQSLKPHQDPIRVGYFSPRSTVFTYGGEQEGVKARPAAKTPFEEIISQDKDDDEDDDGVWDHVQENHRLYGGIIILFMLLAVLGLLFGRSLGIRQKVSGVKGWIMGKISKSSVRFTKLTAFEEDLERADNVELGQFESSLNDQQQEGNLDEEDGRKDSFEI